MRFFTHFSLILIGFLLVGCQSSDSWRNGGQIVLWHGWSADDETVLDRALLQFESVYPNTEVISVAIPDDQLLWRYQDTAALGLGPDLLIGDARWLRQLADNDLIKPVEIIDVDSAQYNETAYGALQYEESQFALPFMVDTKVLYYNTELLLAAPATFEALSLQLDIGRVLALPVGFDETLWGLGAFGAPLIDSRGDINTDLEGLIRWMSWLKAALPNPNVIMDGDPVALKNLFLDGRADMYIGDSAEFRELMVALPNTLGIAPLPVIKDTGNGTPGVATPVLAIEAFFFNSASSGRQHAMARELALFLSNPTQSTTFMRETDRVPANSLVNISSGVDAPQFAMKESTAHAVVILPEIEVEMLNLHGEKAYTNLLSGIETPRSVSCVLVRSLLGELERTELLPLIEDECTQTRDAEEG